jgi:hypothetical protein
MVISRPWIIQKDMRSASAPMVIEGLAPSAVGITEPSTT